MTQAELDDYRQQLLDLRSRLRGDVSHLTSEALRKTGGEASGSLSNTPIHMADLGTDNFEQEFTLGLIENEEQALDEIGAALDRLDQKTFGRCERVPEGNPTGAPAGAALHPLLRRVCQEGRTKRVRSRWRNDPIASCSGVWPRPASCWTRPPSTASFAGCTTAAAATSARWCLAPSTC